MADDESPLGALIFKLDSDDKDRSRIANSLKDPGSIQSRLFKAHALKDKHFSKELAPTLQKKIAGFRPGTKKFNEMAFDLVVKALSTNRAQKSYWSYYKACVVSEITETYPDLSEVLDEKPDLADQGDMTVDGFFVQQLCKKAAAYGLGREEVERLVEVIPIQKPDNFDSLVGSIRALPGIAPLQKKVHDMEGQISDLGSEIAQLRQDLRDSVSKTELHAQFTEIRRSEKQFKAEFEKRSTKSETKLSKAEAATKALSGDQAKFKREIEEVRKTLGKTSGSLSERVQATEKTLEELDALNEAAVTLSRALEIAVEKLSARIANLEEIDSEEGGHAANEQGNGAVARAPNFPASLRKSAPRGAEPDTREISLAEAFSQLKKIHGLGSPEHQKAVSDLMTISFMNCHLSPYGEEHLKWLKAVGWGRKITTLCAAPNWIDQSVLTDELCWLIESHSEPRTLVILDFDVGYTEGYLIPPLKMLQASASVAPWKKIVLVPSCSDWQAPVELLQLLGLLSSRSERPLYDSETEKSIALLMTGSDAEETFKTPELSFDYKAAALEGDASRNESFSNYQLRMLVAADDNQEDMDAMISWLQAEYQKRIS